MKPVKAPGYWPTRILLAVVGIGLILVSAFLAWFTPQLVTDPRSPITLGSLVISAWLSPQIMALLVALVGLAWMIPIVRGPRDKPPRWRYRDR